MSSVWPDWAATCDLRVGVLLYVAAVFLMQEWERWVRSLLQVPPAATAWSWWRLFFWGNIFQMVPLEEKILRVSQPTGRLEVAPNEHNYVISSATWTALHMVKVGQCCCSWWWE